MVTLNKPMKNIAAFLQPMFFYLLIAGSFFLSLVQLENYDIWLHLKTGEWIINNLAVPHTQLFSYSIGAISWVDHSWFFQVLIFIVYKFLGGVDSLVFFRAVAVSLVLWITLKGFLKKVYFPVFLVVAGLFSVLFLDRVPVRPELVSAFFLAIYLYILFNKKNLLMLIPIQYLWVNMHGYSMLGPVLLFFFILSEFIKDRFKLPFDWNKVKFIDDKITYNKSLVVLTITAFLFLLSPYGTDAFRYPLFAIKTFFEGANNFYYVSELYPSSLFDILFTQRHVLLTSTIVIYMLSFLWNIRRINLFNIFIFVVFFLMCYAASRHKGFFAIVSCFCILDNFRASSPQSLKGCFKFRYLRVLSIVVAFLIGFYILWQQLSKARELQNQYVYSSDLSSKNYMYGINQSRYPEKAADFILENNINGPLFNGFNIGGYLIWRLYPSYKVFVDGRTEMYGKRFMDVFVRSMVDFKRWEELDERYGFNAVVLDYSSADFYHHIIKSLYDSDKWKLVYFGDVAMIFVKDNSINRHIISSYEILFENMQDDQAGDYSREASVYPGYFLNKARFFINAMNMPGLTLRSMQKAEFINPECYEVYQLLGYTYFKMGRFEEAKAAFKRSLEINPRIAEPYINLGSVAAESGLYEEAHYLYKHALRLDKNNKIARDNLNRLPYLP